MKIDKYILLLALQVLKQEVIDAMKNKETEEGIKISEQHLARIKKQINHLSI